jgi:8-oxo-dGTP pyrophosphatase MutT (NUDIX family)
MATGANDMYSNTISACGCLFYKLVEGELYLLLITYADPEWSRYDDFGGKIDLTDASVMDAIIRETSEETNHIINKKILRKCDYDEFYNRQSKYYSILIEVDDDFYPDTSIFGEYENTDKIKRTVDWHKYNDCKNNLAYRLLNNKKLIKFLDEKQENGESDGESYSDADSTDSYLDEESDDSDKESVEEFLEEPESESDDDIDIGTESDMEEQPVKIIRHTT